ncbi:interleukin-20 receptor subunit alpha [Syngnathoides biaculeatus]|uniref:interleukin-20 receptor subunit alpha n=1 Tax=Syngnathoides biaculeatus TaxID=300417 RepID=UPI002ADDB90B|nr:interleukin-20 receptor subunit alpha [Syngnathoides biaculeatus]
MSPFSHKCGLYFFVILWGASSTTGSFLPPTPVNVSFSSLNLRNLVQWIPGQGTPDGTRYTVQLAIYGDSVEGTKGKRVNWRPVPWCKETGRTWCDVSRETWDLQQEYYARVRSVGSAFSKWVVTDTRFAPKSDTTFGPPQISVEVKDNNAIILLSGPIRYQPDEHAPPISMASIYPRMTYNLSVHNTRQEQVHHFPVSSSQYKYRLMDYDSEYCFSAKAKLLSLHSYCHQSERHCIKTAKDPVSGQVWMVVVGIAVPSLCICVLLVISYILYHYLMGNGQKRPNTLDLVFLGHQIMPLPQDLITRLNSECSSDDDDDSASGCGSPNAIQNPQPAPQPVEPINYLPSYGEIVMCTTEAGAQGDNHPEENDSHPASQCYFPQAQRSDPPENAAQNQADFSPYSYLANTAPDGLRIPVTKGKEVTGTPYRMQNEDVQSVPPPFACHGGPSDLTADDYGVLVPTAAEQDEEGGPLCIDWGPQMTQLVLETTVMQGEDGGGGETVANGDLRSEKGFLGQASEEEAGPPQAGAAGWEMDEFVKNWNLVISMNE